MGIVIDGKYRIVRQISSGGMGVIFEAVNESSGGRVVLKVPSVDVAREMSADELNPINERLKQEVQAAIRAGAQHPGIVRMMDCVQLAGGALAIVMEYLEGELLCDRIKAKGGRLPISDVVRIGRQLASALAAAHAAGVIHRDLKPSNVMIVRDPDVTGGERVKVFDFGIAKVPRTNKSQQLTQVGWFMGTRFYSAPEQLSDTASVDGKADVYSLAAVLYEMLGGSLPLVTKLPRVEPPWLLRLIVRMAAVDPDLRPDMEEVAAALSAPPEERRLRPELGWALFASLLFIIGAAGFWTSTGKKEDAAQTVTSADLSQRESREEIPADLATPIQPPTPLPLLQDLAVTNPPDLAQVLVDASTPQDAAHGRDEDTRECPLVKAGCLSLSHVERTSEEFRLIKQALTQDVRFRLCPDRKLTLVLRGNVLVLEDPREIDPRARSIINMSLASLLGTLDLKLPPKVVVRCKR